MKNTMILILILAFTLCKPTTSSSNKSNQALFPLALLGSTTVSSEYEIPYATCEGAKEFTKETGTVTDQTPANTIKYFKFNSAKTESLNFSVNPSTGNGNGSFCLFGFVQNQTVDNNSSLDTLETTSDYCVSSFSLSTNASSYRCIAVLALSSGGSFDINTSAITSGSTTTTTSSSYFNIKPDFNSPTLLADGQTTNEIFTDYSSWAAFKAADNYGGGKYFKFTIPANKTALLSISNVNSTTRIDGGFYSATGSLLTSFGLNGFTASNRSLTLTADNISEDVIFYAGGGSKGNTYSLSIKIQGTIETKSFISSGLQTPNGLAIDSSDNIYVVDTNARKVLKYNSTGVLQWSIGNGVGDVVGNNTVAKFTAPNGIAIDSAGNIFITDTGAYKVKMIDPSGTNISLIAGSTMGDNGLTPDVVGTSAKFNTAMGIAVDNTYIYVADRSNHNIRRIKKANNTVSMLAGAPNTNGKLDGIGTDARLWYPYGVTIFDGSLYITEDGSAVRKLNLTTSEVTTLTSKTFGYSNADTPSVQIYGMAGIESDNAGNLYISSSNVVFKMNPAGKTFHFAGSGNSGDILSYGVKSKFWFSGLSDLAFDSLGNLYIADSNNAKIKKIVFSP
jgi:hypothetical protein